ncbi:MAG TPA: hypothetical protein VHC22_33270 [Pirellulales bacterium]|nr:hypothetical protein [Pirellulales bacterium]
MKRAILLAIVLVGGAFYLGWFTFTTDSSGPNEHVNIVINKDKVHADEARAIEKLHSFEQQAQAQGQAAVQDETQAQNSPAARFERTARQALRQQPQSVSDYQMQQPQQQYQTAQPQYPGAQPQYPANPAQPQYQNQPAGYANEPAQGGVDPYELPQRSRPQRPAADTNSETFSRGFE